MPSIRIVITKMIKILMKRILLIQFIILLVLIPVSAQNEQQDLAREVTLYNPYKPSLSLVKKRSYLPAMNDTSGIRPDFTYQITSKPFFPEYTISPIKAASLLPDPLPRLYKSYVKIGIGNYITPFAEVSITNERSKKGAIGFYARHFSTNGKVKLQNDEKVFAGYMDNDASLYGKKFFRKNLLEGSLDFRQKTRYAYGYDPSLTYSPEKKDIRLNYYNPAANLSFSSITLDSTSFTYDFNLDYDFFFNTSDLFQHHAGVDGIMATSFKGFYVGSGAEFDLYLPSGDIYEGSKYIVSLNPFLKKSTQQWNFKAGIQLLLDKDTSDSPEFHFYPDVRFGFNIVPEYISFFAALNGRLEVNAPQRIIDENPFIFSDGTLFTLKNTSYPLIVSAGLNGNTGIGGNYLVSASYSFINDMLFFTNLGFPGGLGALQFGNYFGTLSDDGELLQIHGEMTGRINDQFMFYGSANWYKYTLSVTEFPWNKPDWDGRIGIKYNLRDKIISGLYVTALGKRNLLVTNFDPLFGVGLYKLEEPVHVNLNFSAEYRYTKILSFWLKLDNISFKQYYEWAYYPSQRFMGLVGFTYSL
jgi:hypothetical protein